MNKQKAILIATALFPTYPTVKEFHVTHDGQAFEKKHDADAHAASFTKKDEQEVIAVTRAECEATEATPLEKAQAAFEKAKSTLANLEAAAEKATGAAKEKAAKSVEKQREKLAAAEQAVADLTVAE